MSFWGKLFGTTGESGRRPPLADDPTASFVACLPRGDYFVIAIDDARGGAAAIAEDIASVAHQHQSDCRHRTFPLGDNFEVGGLTVANRAMLVVGGLQGLSASSVAVFTASQREARIVTRATHS